MARRARPQLGVDPEEEAALLAADRRGDDLLRHWRAGGGGPRAISKKADQQQQQHGGNSAATSHLSSPLTPQQSTHNQQQQLLTTPLLLSHTGSSVSLRVGESARQSPTNGGGRGTATANDQQTSQSVLIVSPSATHVSTSLNSGTHDHRQITSSSSSQPQPAVSVSNKAAGILDSLLGPGRWRSDPQARKKGGMTSRGRHLVGVRVGLLPTPSTLVPVHPSPKASDRAHSTLATTNPQLITISPCPSDAASATSSLSPSTVTSSASSKQTSNQVALLAHNPHPKILSPLEEAVSEHRVAQLDNKRRILGRQGVKGSQPRKLAPVTQHLHAILASVSPTNDDEDNIATKEGGGDDDMQPDWSAPDVPHLKGISHTINNNNQHPHIGGGELVSTTTSNVGSQPRSHSRTCYQLVPGTWAVSTTNQSHASSSSSAHQPKGEAVVASNLGKGTVGVGPKAAAIIETQRTREIRAEFLRSHPQPIQGGPLTVAPVPAFVSVEQRRAEAQQRLHQLTQEARDERVAYRIQLEKDQRIQNERRVSQQRQVQKEQQAALQRKEERKAVLMAQVEIRRQQERIEREREKEDVDARQEERWQDYSERREHVAAQRDASTLRQMATFGDKRRAAAIERAALAAKSRTATQLLEENSKLTHMMVQRDKAISRNAAALAQQRNEESKQRSVAQVHVESEENATIIANRRGHHSKGMAGRGGGGASKGASPHRMSSLRDDPNMPP